MIGRPGRNVGAPVAIGLIVTGAMIVFGLGVLGLARTPSSAPTQPGSPAPVSTSGAHALQQRGLTRSDPVRLAIPAIGVDGALQRLGLNADRKTMQLPGAAQAGWFDEGATPGETGPTVVVGYITSRTGPGVFAHLGALKAGALVELRRADGQIVTYGVDQVAAYPAKDFPTTTVYAPTPQPTLRLVTCGGQLRPGAPIGNVVVYGHQVSVRR
jgi:sortase (surface protein transpeptidase)